MYDGRVASAGEEPARNLDGGRRFRLLRPRAARTRDSGQQRDARAGVLSRRVWSASGDLGRVEQIDDGGGDRLEQRVSRTGRQGADPLEQVVKVRLGQSRPAGQAALGKLAVADFSLEEGNEARVQGGKQRDGSIRIYFSQK